MTCSVTTFTAPNNSTVAAPSAAFIEERLRNGGKGYWQANSLTAAIEHSGAGTTLVLMVEPGEGSTSASLRPKAGTNGRLSIQESLTFAPSRSSREARRCSCRATNSCPFHLQCRP